MSATESKHTLYQYLEFQEGTTLDSVIAQLLPAGAESKLVPKHDSARAGDGTPLEWVFDENGQDAPFSWSGRGFIGTSLVKGETNTDFTISVIASPRLTAGEVDMCQRYSRVPLSTHYMAPETKAVSESINWIRVFDTGLGAFEARFVYENLGSRLMFRGPFGSLTTIASVPVYVRVTARLDEKQTRQTLTQSQLRDLPEDEAQLVQFSVLCDERTLRSSIADLRARCRQQPESDRFLEDARKQLDAENQQRSLSQQSERGAGDPSSAQGRR